MTSLVVDFAQLQAAIDRMSRFGREVDECLADVEQAMGALRATWHGSGSDAQAEAQQRWDDGAEQMKSALSMLQKAAETARTNYAEAVSKNGQMWG